MVCNVTRNSKKCNSQTCIGFPKGFPLLIYHISLHLVSFHHITNRLNYETKAAKYAQYCVKGVVLNAHGIVMSPTSSPAFYGCLVATIRSARAQAQLSSDEPQLCSKEARKIVELSPWAIYVQDQLFQDIQKSVKSVCHKKLLFFIYQMILTFLPFKKKSGGCCWGALSSLSYIARHKNWSLL